MFLSLDYQTCTNLYLRLLSLDRYNENSFHSFEHASHVTMSVVKLMSRIVAPRNELSSTREENCQQDLAATLHDHTYGITSDPLTQFACVISALIHDGTFECCFVYC